MQLFSFFPQEPSSFLLYILKRKANVSLFFQKGEKYDDAFCIQTGVTHIICCKTLVHIIVNNTNKH